MYLVILPIASFILHFMHVLYCLLMKFAILFILPMKVQYLKRNYEWQIFECFILPISR